MSIPKKSLGQNFLIDKNIARKIAQLCNKPKEKIIIEVGPGKGALTDQIIDLKPKKIVLIEKDKNLYNDLLNKYQKLKFVKIYNDDAINFDYNQFAKPKTIISNLPYNISIKLIFNWFKKINNYEEIILMIQKEVAKKMEFKNIAKKNRLNFMTEIFSNFKIEFNVSKNVFYPKPKINSSVIKIIPKKNIKYDFNALENFSRKIFHNKRKKLSNVIDIAKIKNMNKFANSKVFEKRAEDLNLEELLSIFNEY